MKDSIYGPKFKKLRKEQNITLVQAAHGITSKSTLSLWENGNDNLSFSQVLALLQKVHIQPMEFMNNLVSPNLHLLARDLNKAFVKNNISYLHNYASKRLNKARLNPQNKYIFLEACVACNFYKNLSNDNLLTSNEINELNNILSNFSDWNYINIFFFGNTLELLSPKIIYRLTISLITCTVNQNLNEKRWYEEIIESILNAISILTRIDYKKAEKILNKLNEMHISDRFGDEKIHVKMFQVIIGYIKTKNTQDVNYLIDDLDFLGLDELKDGFITGFKQIKQIYG